MYVIVNFYSFLFFVCVQASWFICTVSRNDTCVGVDFTDKNSAHFSLIAFWFDTLPFCVILFSSVTKLHACVTPTFRVNCS